MALSKADMLAIAQMMQAAPAAVAAPVAPSALAPPPTAIVAAPAPAPHVAPAPGSGLPVTIAGQSLVTSPLRTFSSGKKGWNLTGKVIIDGRRVQVSGNFVIVEDKPKQ